LIGNPDGGGGYIRQYEGAHHNGNGGHVCGNIVQNISDRSANGQNYRED
jgi:hypothetical protein